MIGTSLAMTGTLPSGSFVALIAATAATEYNPCVFASKVSTNADSLHSGVLLLAPNVIVPQLTFLDPSAVFTWCYTHGDGSASDIHWRDSYIRVRSNKLVTLTCAFTTHITSGTLGDSNNMACIYAGSILSSAWVALVEASTNSNQPCDTEAAYAPDTLHSGSIRAAASGHVPSITGAPIDATTRTVHIDTSSLDTTAMFAVCYTETNASWSDSGIRLRVSKISQLTYGHPTRTMDGTYKAANRLPQSGNANVVYHGDLAANKYISFVALSSNAYRPCDDGAVAAASIDSTHSGSLQAGGGKAVVFPSGLIQSTLFAVCYADSTGSATDQWYDSAIRVSTSQVTSVFSHKVTHITDGQLAAVAVLDVVYAGTLGVNKWVSMVDQTLNNDAPCEYGPVAAAAADSQHSGVSQADSDRILRFD